MYWEEEEDQIIIYQLDQLRFFVNKCHVVATPTVEYKNNKIYFSKIKIKINK